MWTTEHQSAFDGIKAYLANPPVLMPPNGVKPVKLFIAAAEDSLGAFLGQDNEKSREQAVYYLSRFLNSCECKYSAVEKALPCIVFCCNEIKILPFAYNCLDNCNHRFG